MADEHILAMKDIVDNQLITSDGVRIGRPANIIAEYGPDRTLRLTAMVAGPEALSGRVSSYLQPIFHAILGGRWERRIPVEDLQDVGINLELKHEASHYRLGESDRWLASHILRWIPGSGYR